MNQGTLEFIEELKQRPDVLGVIMFGSWARGNNRPDSDVDLVVIVSEGYKRAIEYKNNQAFEIIYVTESGALDFWKNNKDDCASLWDVAKIIYDKEGVVEELAEKAKDIIKSGKPILDKASIERYKFDANDSLKYAESVFESDPVTAQIILNNKISELVSLSFDLKQLWIPGPKQIKEKIKEINPELYAVLQDFYKDGIDFNSKLNLGKSMINLVLKD